MYVDNRQNDEYRKRQSQTGKNICKIMYLIQHICVCMRVHMPMCVNVQARGQRHCLLPHWLDWPVNEPLGSSCLLPVLGLQTAAIMPSCLHGLWVWNSGPQAYTWALSLLSWVLSPLTLVFSKIYEEPLWFTREEGNYFLKIGKTVETALCIWTHQPASRYLSKREKVCLFKAPDISAHVSLPLRPRP